MEDKLEADPVRTSRVIYGITLELTELLSRRAAFGSAGRGASQADKFRPVTG